MDDIRFERHFRTPHSEGYYIMQGSSLQSNNRLGTVGIHCFRTDYQAFRNLVICVTLGYQLQYFAFAFRQATIAIFLLAAANSLQVISYHDRLGSWREVELSAAHHM